jgi:hypothetical protein
MLAVLQRSKVKDAVRTSSFPTAQWLCVNLSSYGQIFGLIATAIDGAMDASVALLQRFGVRSDRVVQPKPNRPISFQSSSQHTRPQKPPRGFSRPVLARGLLRAPFDPPCQESVHASPSRF